MLKVKLIKAKPMAVFALLIFAIMLAGCTNEKARSATYEFTNIRRANIERTVSASGTIHPVATVKVLPRMSGKVEKVFVDYNDTVRIGDILAELNTDMLRLQRDQQYANVSKARANYELQLINFQSQEALAEKNLISEFELRTGRTNLDNMAADLAVAEANLRKIETEISQYAYITSPINGIVLDRNINPGDTVVDSTSSSSASIFVLAENLRDMQIEAGVGELDIASIHKGQSVRFTLESLPGRSFTGTVENLRMVPMVSNNVVSYTVIISAQNPDGSLLPGMTCAVDFIVERSENALTVSNAALRYQPTTLSADRIEEMIFYASLAEMDEEQRTAALEARAEATQAASQSSSSSSGIAGILTGGGGQQRPPPRPVAGQGRRVDVVMRNIWYFTDDGRLEVMRVQTGISNGTSTEIFSAENLEGKQVILRERL